MGTVYVVNVCGMVFFVHKPLANTQFCQFSNFSNHRKFLKYSRKVSNVVDKHY